MPIDIEIDNTQVFSGYKDATGANEKDFKFLASQVFGGGGPSTNYRRAFLRTEESQLQGKKYKNAFFIPGGTPGRLKVVLTNVSMTNHGAKFGVLINNDLGNVINSGLNVTGGTYTYNTGDSPGPLTFKSEIIQPGAPVRYCTPFVKSTTSQADNIGQLLSFGTITVVWEDDDDGDVELMSEPICFSGDSRIKILDGGEKKIKNLKRGELILTNDGYQPLAELNVGFNPSDELMVKIPKDFLSENVPSEDVYVTKTHPLSIKIISADDDKDFEYLHLFVKELMQLGVGMEYVKKDKKTKLYNLIFDNHYEINVGNMKFLSHHPNHNNGNKRLEEGKEINSSYRTKKVYADDKGIYFKIITLKKVLKQKPENMTDKEYLASVLRFD
jgi:hypothetical protein